MNTTIKIIIAYIIRIIIYFILALLGMCAVAMISYFTLLPLEPYLNSAGFPPFTGEIFIAVAAIIAAIVSNKRGAQTVPRFQNEKHELYKEMIDDLFKILRQDEDSIKKKVLVRFAHKYAQRVHLYGSSSVVRLCYYIYSYAKNDNKNGLDVLYVCEQTVEAIREDLGHGGKLRSGRILSLYRDKTDSELRSAGRLKDTILRL